MDLLRVLRASVVNKPQETLTTETRRGQKENRKHDTTPGTFCLLFCCLLFTLTTPMKFLLLAALLLCSFTDATAQDEPLILMTARNINRPELRLEAIALIDQGQFKAPGGTERKDAAAFIKQYLPVGRKFFVVFGGGAAGTISITWTDRGCNNRIHANGPISPGSLGIARIHGEVLGPLDSPRLPYTSSQHHQPVSHRH